MPTLTIELPSQKEQTEFNLRRWAELLEDPEMEKLPRLIETDRYGNIVMSPLPAPRHGYFQAELLHLLRKLLPQGKTLGPCPISTAGGSSETVFVFRAPQRFALKFAPREIPKPKFGRKPPSTWTQARKRCGFVILSARSAFLALVDLSFPPPEFVRHFQRRLKCHQSNSCRRYPKQRSAENPPG
jgi:hypothetical protein